MNDNQNTESLLALFRETERAIKEALAKLDDWGLSGKKPTQYKCDVAADNAALEVMEATDMLILSEETGLHGIDEETLKAGVPKGETLVVIDPVDGSTNAFHGVPWYALSLCAWDSKGALASYVVNLATESVPAYSTIRGGKAFQGEVELSPSGKTETKDSLIGFSAKPDALIPEPLKECEQVRAMGAAALDICLVAAGRLDAYLDCTYPGMHSPWDYMGAAFICENAGASVGDSLQRDLALFSATEKRQPIAAATDELLEKLRQGIKPPA